MTWPLSHTESILESKNDSKYKTNSHLFYSILFLLTQHNTSYSYNVNCCNGNTHPTKNLLIFLRILSFKIQSNTVYSVQYKLYDVKVENGLPGCWKCMIAACMVTSSNEFKDDTNLTKLSYTYLYGLSLVAFCSEISFFLSSSSSEIFISSESRLNCHGGNHCVPYYILYMTKKHIEDNANDKTMVMEPNTRNR